MHVKYNNSEELEEERDLVVGEQVVDVDEAADRILECKAGIAEIAKRFEIRNKSSVFGLDVFVLTNSFDCQESDSTIMLG